VVTRSAVKDTRVSTTCQPMYRMSAGLWLSIGIWVSSSWQSQQPWGARYQLDTASAL